MDCNSLPGLNRTAFPGGMETSAPVRGLRPMPVFRGRTLNTPKPRSSMRSPLASDRFMLSKTVSTASSALVLVIPVLFTTSLMMSSFITGGSQAEESLQSNQVLDAKEDKRDCQLPASYAGRTYDCTNWGGARIASLGEATGSADTPLLNCLLRANPGC